MEIQFNDDYLEKLPVISSISTTTSEGSLDDLNLMKQTNDCLRKELEKKSEECRLVRKMADQAAEKDLEIQKLRAELEKMTEERDSLQHKLKEAGDQKVSYKPVSNPLQTVLVNQLQEKGVIRSKEVEDVMRSIDRGDFAPKDPYIDRPQQIGFNTTISAPHMHATQLEILVECFKDAKKVVDIGTGSGYVALSLAKMMKGAPGKVYALDHIPKLVEQARENIAKNHKEYIDEGRIEFVVADGREGLPQYAPFDIIFVGGAVREIPECLVEQLAPGGSMIIPVGDFYQYLMVIHKTLSGKIERNPTMPVMFGKLQSVEEQCPDIDE